MTPTEEQVQNAVAEYLDALGVLWCHSPNGGKRDKIAGARLRRQGAKPGVPDVLIFGRPPSGDFVGAALELKIKGGRVSEQQRGWLDALEDRGWFTAVCVGVDEAIKTIEFLGYGQ